MSGDIVRGLKTVCVLAVIGLGALLSLGIYGAVAIFNCVFELVWK
jgi:hypothetical protein